MNKEGAEKVLFTMDERFRFSCRKGLACYNRCCRDLNIFLTPYDVLRLRRATGMSSQEFMQRHTETFVGEDGILLVALKMMEDEKGSCPFVAPEGCSVYEDRPWSCRMYPVFPMSIEEEQFLIEKISTCLGFKEQDEVTVREWKESQSIDIYDKMNKSYKDITQHEFFQRGNILDSGKAKLLYTACYDLDTFRKLIFESRFLEKYDVEKDVVEKMRDDDEELLNFAYRWIRFSLFSEDTLRLRDKEMDKLLQSRMKTSS
ncbi:MAG: YkgJ family cysteine cluster protein [Syntrophobacteraceae bacterium]|nr:YkgJ family cysteine cluster protein [Syntrophobacteraceae bacterium]